MGCHTASNAVMVRHRSRQYNAFRRGRVKDLLWSGHGRVFDPTCFEKLRQRSGLGGGHQKSASTVLDRPCSVIDLDREHPIARRRCPSVPPNEVVGLLERRRHDTLPRRKGGHDARPPHRGQGDTRIIDRDGDVFQVCTSWRELQCREDACVQLGDGVGAEKRVHGLERRRAGVDVTKSSLKVISPSL